MNPGEDQDLEPTARDEPPVEATELPSEPPEAVVEADPPPYEPLPASPDEPLPAPPGGAVPVMQLGALSVIAAGIFVSSWRISWPGLSERHGAFASAVLEMAGGFRVPPLDAAPLHSWVLGSLLARSGANELSMRFPGVALAAFVLIALGIAVRARPSTEKGGTSLLLAPATLAGVPLWWFAGRALDPSVTGALFGALAVTAILAGDPGRGLEGWRGWCLYLAGALAWLAGAGPAGLLIPWAVVVLHLALHGRVSSIRGVTNHSGAIAALALLVAVYALALIGSTSESRALWLESISTAARQWTSPPTVGFPQLLPWLALFPAALFLPSAAIRGVGADRGRVALVAIVIPLAVGLWTPIPATTAAILAAPALAFLVGRDLSERVSMRHRLPELWLVVAVLIFGSVAAMVQRVPLSPILSIARAGTSFQFRLMASAALGVSAALLGAGLLTRRHGQTLLLVAVGFCGIGVASVEFLGAPIDRALSHRAFLADAQELLAPDTECVVLGGAHDVVAFYVANPVESVSEIEEIRELRDERTGRLYVIAPADTDLPEAALELKEEQTEFASSVAWLDAPLGLWVLGSLPPKEQIRSFNGEPEPLFGLPSAPPDESSPAPATESEPLPEAAPAPPTESAPESDPAPRPKRRRGGSTLI